MKKSYSLWFIDEILDKLKTGQENDIYTIAEEKDFYFKEIRSHFLWVIKTFRERPDFKSVKSDMEKGFKYLKMLFIPVPPGKNMLDNIQKTGNLIGTASLFFKNLIALSRPLSLYDFLDYYIEKEIPVLASGITEKKLEALSLFDSIYKKATHRELIENFYAEVREIKEKSRKELEKFQSKKNTGKVFKESNNEERKFSDHFEEKLLNYRERELESFLSYALAVEEYFSSEDKRHLDRAKGFFYEAYCNKMRYDILFRNLRKLREPSGKIMREVSLSMACPLAKDYTLKEKMESVSNKTGIMELIPFFTVLRGEDIKGFALKIKLRKYSSGEILFHEGDGSEELYIIKSGEFTVYKENEGTSRDYIKLYKGDMFGEMGVILGLPRSMSVRVSSPSGEVYVITKKDFLAILEKHYELSLNLCRILCKRIEETNKRLFHYLKDYYVYIKEKVTDSRRKSEIVKGVTLFSILTEKEIERLSHRIKFKRFPVETVLFYEGDRAEDLYIIKSGEVSIYKDLPGGERRDYVTLKKGDLFGEMGVITGSPRSFSVKVSSLKSEVYVITKEDFLYMMEKYPHLSLNLAKILSGRIADTNKRLFSLW